MQILQTKDLASAPASGGERADARSEFRPGADKSDWNRVCVVLMCADGRKLSANRTRCGQVFGSQ